MCTKCVSTKFGNSISFCYIRAIEAASVSDDEEGKGRHTEAKFHGLGPVPGKLGMQRMICLQNFGLNQSRAVMQSLQEDIS